MARMPRIEYPGAIYHVINRGNYRRDLFDSAGAAESFIQVLEEATTRFGWELGSYVLMRNHFHLALRTPDPNLSRGMQWLQVTFASRFNRFRHETGHLFQGRYKAILLQNEWVWGELSDYIHLNPVRARIVDPDQMHSFRWSSLNRLRKGPRFKGLNPLPWLQSKGLEDTPEGWAALISALRARAGEAGGENHDAEVDASWSKGWAIGDDAWLAEMAQLQVSNLKDSANSEYTMGRKAEEIRWDRRLRELCRENGETRDLTAGYERWKIDAALKMRRELGTPVVWLAKRLRVGSAGSLRVYLHRRGRSVNK
ncbi:transposase [Synoicihabitans lomoniglobus]|uniref:Transposase n=1 Tax=Synoicihabitans lomoniglobus TaxID=2909285 RepID=A0AAF0CMZ8_9BACT|nr:transposase [Opitutaceae bacterium LMO-M01]WED63770.1 transposase [Opitutaceae bacterium LMO-M01]